MCISASNSSMTLTGKHPTPASCLVSHSRTLHLCYTVRSCVLQPAQVQNQKIKHPGIAFYHLPCWCGSMCFCWYVCMRGLVSGSCSQVWHSRSMAAPTVMRRVEAVCHWPAPAEPSHAVCKHSSLSAKGKLKHFFPLTLEWHSILFCVCI